MLNIKENCKELKAKLKQQYPSVTDDDLQCNDGRKEEMLERLQQKLGKTGEELNEVIIKL
jgi:uncharacterized protein YjbJ (UPF0337 family)